MSQIGGSYYCCSKFDTASDINVKTNAGLRPKIEVFVNQDRWCALEEPATFLTSLKGQDDIANEA